MKLLPPVKEVKVGLNFGSSILSVGRLALHQRKIYFEFTPEFTAGGLEISPLRLPLGPGVHTFETSGFDGLPGVFYDCLPDGWGRLLLDRLVRSVGVQPSELTPLDRLVYQGSRGLGALVFEPDHGMDCGQSSINIDFLAKQAQDVLSGSADDALSELLNLNGSSAGARPKALIGINGSRSEVIHGMDDLPKDFKPWIVKFPNTRDGLDAGAVEYVYSLMAKEAGLIIPETHLFKSDVGAGYFAIQRFDRKDSERYHMHSVCGLLHSDFRTPSLDYEDLITLTGHLTRDVREMERMFRLAVFNVLSHNRDDHAKNFTFLMDQQGHWSLSPAYDLTFSTGPNGEQSTLVMGEGRTPTSKGLLRLAEIACIKRASASEIIEATRAGLSLWPTLAKQYGVRNDTLKLIEKRLNAIV